MVESPLGIQSTPLVLVIIFSSQLKLSYSPLPRFFCPSLCSAFVSLSSDNADTGMGDNGGNAITIATTSTVRNVGILIINFIDLHKVVIVLNKKMGGTKDVLKLKRILAQRESNISNQN